MTKANRQQYNDLKDFLNHTSHSGYVNVRAVIAAMATLIGLPVDEYVSQTRML